ncbi:MAG TPA: methionine--tRNA ligase [Ktedonobacteraceae bacterium]|nr:methionine--tRNA ligase [Ktedonobacteraceae bacterium]
MEQSQEAGGDGRRRYYITTAIDYPNAEPHIGHSQEKVAADVVARYKRLRGYETYFSMGLDENSQHVVRAAEANQMELAEWVAHMDRAFRLAWSKLDISYDRWLRTTEEIHFRASQEMFRRAQERGDVYKAIYSGWYCPNCNTFYRDEDLLAGKCPEHPMIELEWVEEENYFFALTRYSERLLAYIATHPRFIAPPSRLAEVMSFFHQGLRDFSVSRRVDPQRPVWGVPVPGDPEQVLYVWFDALTNYLTAVGFPANAVQFARYWPADVHVVGKDIVRFHCLYWPAMLMSAELPLPGQIAVHGFITLEGKKISKSRGNVVSPVALVDEFGADAVRYYLMRNLAFGSDGDFTRAGLLQRYNDELAKDLGNLLNRVVSMVKRYRKGIIPYPGVLSELEQDLQCVAGEARQGAEQALENWEIGRALECIWSLVRRANQYLEQSEPWKLARQADRQEHLNTVLYSAAEALRLLAIYLAPVMPAASAQIMAQLGCGPIQSGAWESETAWGAVPLQAIGESAILFPRIEEAGEIEANVLAVKNGVE